VTESLEALVRSRWWSGLDEALRWAALIPAASAASVEIRPVVAVPEPV
jgi:hypothetical protein